MKRKRNFKTQSEPSCKMILLSSYTTRRGKNDLCTRRENERFCPAWYTEPSILIERFMKNGSLAKEYPYEREMSRHDFNQYVDYYKYIFVIYHKKVVGYEIRKRGPHYNKRIINIIPMDRFPESYVYIGEVVTTGRLNCVITTTYDEAFMYLSKVDHAATKMIYQVPLDHLGGPDYYFMNWSRWPEVEGWNPDKEYFYDICDQLPKDLEAKKEYFVRLFGYIQYTFDPDTNVLLKKEMAGLDDPWDWDVFNPEYYYTWDRSVLFG